MMQGEPNLYRFDARRAAIEPEKAHSDRKWRVLRDLNQQKVEWRLSQSRSGSASRCFFFQSDQLRRRRSTSTTTSPTLVLDSRYTKWSSVPIKAVVPSLTTRRNGLKENAFTIRADL